jgi:acyl-CoA thioesterase-1
VGLLLRGAMVLLVPLLTATCGGSDPPAPRTGQAAESSAAEGLIVALGDSLTAGLGLPEEEAWPALLERRLQADGFPWDVHNAGVSGETSSGARGRIGWILQLEPDIVVLETGGNDGLRGIPPRVLRENLGAMLTALEEAGVIIVFAGMRMVENLGADCTRQCARVYTDLAERHGVIFIPFLLEGVAGNTDLNQADGIHPTADGHRIIAETVHPYAVEAIGKVRANGVSP